MQRQLTIGLLMDFLQLAIIDGAGAYARQHGLRLDARWSVRADWMPSRPRWDGVLVYLIDMETAYERAMGLGLPMLHLSSYLGRRAVPRVECDFAACGRLAEGEFRRLGLRRVAGMGGWRSAVDWRSFRGFRVGAARAGIECVELEAPRRGMDWSAEIERLIGEVAGLRFPCGLFLPHAGMAVSVLEGLAARGVRVPEDVAIIVIDKDPHRTAELAPVPLTTVMPDFWQQGYEAAGLLAGMLVGKEPAQRILRIPPVGLVRRESTGVAGSRDPVVAKVLHVLSGKIGWGLGVTELARRVGVSRRTLETRFRHETGMPLHAAEMRMRLDEAKRLLRNPSRTVAEVASACEFSSVSYFTTVFKREEGMTPGAYQRLTRRG